MERRDFIKAAALSGTALVLGLPIHPATDRELQAISQLPPKTSSHLVALALGDKVTGEWQPLVNVVELEPGVFDADDAVWQSPMEDRISFDHVWIKFHPISRPYVTPVGLMAAAHGGSATVQWPEAGFISFKEA